MKFGSLKSLEKKYSKTSEMFEKYEMKLKEEKELIENERKNILYKHFEKSKMNFEEYVNKLEYLFLESEINETNKVEERNEE